MLRQLRGCFRVFLTKNLLFNKKETALGSVYLNYSGFSLRLCEPHCVSNNPFYFSRPLLGFHSVNSISTAALEQLRFVIDMWEDWRVISLCRVMHFFIELQRPSALNCTGCLFLPGIVLFLWSQSVLRARSRSRSENLLRCEIGAEWNKREKFPLFSEEAGKILHRLQPGERRSSRVAPLYSARSNPVSAAALLARQIYDPPNVSHDKEINWLCGCLLIPAAAGLLEAPSSSPFRTKCSQDEWM